MRVLRAIPTYALYVAMKPRLEHWLLEQPSAQRTKAKDVPKILKAVTWGQQVLPLVLRGLRDFTGVDFHCTQKEHFAFCLRPDRVYSALRFVLLECLLPLHGRGPQVSCFKTLKEIVQAQHHAAMGAYVDDWLQMALQAVRFALEQHRHLCEVTI